MSTTQMSPFGGGSTEAVDLLEKYSGFNQHKVPHVMQDTHWDCGLACVAMILGGVNITACLEDLTNQCAVESIWTIDLAYLLDHYMTHFTYYTSYFGSRKEYQQDSFYQATFDQDELRVNHLFDTARSSGIHVVKGILPLDDFKRFLGGDDCAILVLVNAQLLKCVLCEEKHLMDVPGYFGHFVVLIGYDQAGDKFIYRDPATSQGYCAISTKDLDQARQAEGTDHDCIVVQLG